MNIVVVGAGLAGANAVEELRKQGYTEDITLLGAEPHPPYERPPLSKSVLLGDKEPDVVFVHDRAWYADQQVDLRTDARVTAIDRDRKHVEVAGTQISYDRLLLTTGSQPRRLADLEPLQPLYLRTLEDSLRLKDRLQGTVLIVGAGWIGLEVASAARHAGAEVTAVETAAQPLLAVMGPELGASFAALHREHGVDLHLGTSIASVSDGEVTLADGHRVTPDLVVVGIGAAPDDQVGRDAGLAVDNGLLVDARLRSADPAVFAAGDVANQDHPVLGRRVRVEHWDNAIEQGKHVAGVMLGGDEPYTRLPYFFTDQYDFGMELVGNVGPEGFDELVVRGETGGDRVYTAFWVAGGRVVAGMHANDWDAIGPIREIVGQPFDERLRDPGVPLSELAS
ncbi:MAG: FAD-dependent oxidoreductase [Nocardioidaceae bacterium]|nr:FAD-dependent oxidoreductase [Nocardioidaceae bacterium]